MTVFFVEETLVEKHKLPGQELRRTHKLTTALCEDIARRNGEFTPVEVRAALLSGKPVYTHFNKFQLAKEES
jgi:hypothetical protein